MRFQFIAIVLLFMTGLTACEHTLHEVQTDLGHGQDSKGQGLAKSKELIADGEFENAVVVLQQTVKKDPDQIEPRLLLSGVFLQLEEVDKAEKSLAEVINRWPQRTEAQLLMGYVLLAKQKRKEAQLHFEKVIDNNGGAENRLSAHLGLAAVFEGLKDQARADAHYAKALKIEPNLEKALINVQKELAWYESQPSSGLGEQNKHQIKARQKRIEQELKKLSNKGAGNE